MILNAAKPSIRKLGFALFKPGGGVWFNGQVWRIKRKETFQGHLCILVERRFQSSPDGGLLGSLVRSETYLFPYKDTRSEIIPLGLALRSRAS